MIFILLSFLARGRDILFSEGLISLLKHSFKYFLFDYNEYYLCEIKIQELSESDFMPKISNFTARVVTSNQEADKLKVETGVDIRRHSFNASRGLNSGAIATCIIVDTQIAHIGWVAVSEDAMKAITPLKQRIKFANKEAFVGAAITLPAYRRKGLLTYGSFMRLKYANSIGLSMVRCAVHVRDSTAQNSLVKFDPTIYAKARCIKIFCLNKWTELSLTQEDAKHINFTKLAPPSS
jgi:hypothetical protein